MKGRLGLAAAIATGIVVALAASASAGTLVQISSDPFSKDNHFALSVLRSRDAKAQEIDA